MAQNHVRLLTSNSNCTKDYIDSLKFCRAFFSIEDREQMMGVCTIFILGGKPMWAIFFITRGTAFYVEQPNFKHSSGVNRRHFTACMCFCVIERNENNKYKHVEEFKGVSHGTLYQKLKWENWNEITEQIKLSIIYKNGWFS